MKPLKRLSVERLLHWAFAVECAQLDWPDDAPVEARGQGVGLEWVLMQRAVLGCQVDGGGVTHPPHDAEVVAGAVMRLPGNLGGRRAAIRVAELARARRRPDWMPGAAPQWAPREWRERKGRRFASVEVPPVPPSRRWVWARRSRTGAVIEVEGTWCPVVVDPDPAQVMAARRGWVGWRDALAWLRTELRFSGLERHEVGEELPPVAPWVGDAFQAEDWAMRAPVGD